MPFSTYLCDAAPPTDDRADSRQYPTHGGLYSPSYGSASYYPHPAPSSSVPVAGPSNSSATASNSELSKPYSPHSVASGTSSDGLFQMPSFLMGNFTGTLAPGGGAEVLTPSAFDFFSTPFPTPHDDGKPSWQSAKYYTLDHGNEPRQSTDDVAETATPARSAAPAAAAPVASVTAASSVPAPLSAPASSASESRASVPAASPFGYLNVESPCDRQVPASTPAHQTDSYDEATAPAIAVSSPVEPSSAMTEPGAYRTPLELYAPIPPSGLPVYSQSGFDMLSILARVARRPNPSITLGPVDLTCAFVVADVRRADAPIIYASRTFCELTGYSESEILGRNCRFLQAPGGRVARNEVRRFTSAEAVRELRFALDKDREVQASLINYRKDGQPFVNRVSIVPIPAEDGASEIAFHVGFQVNLNDQPSLIAQRIQEGKFYSGGYGDAYKSQTPTERSARAMGKKLRALLSDESFQSSVPITTTCNSIPPAVPPSKDNSEAPGSNTKSNTPGSAKPDSRDERQWLNLILLEHMPDFVHVLSLKGHFLYVSPGITRALGYSPKDLIGKSVGDFCHPSDAVPLLRELKASTGQTNASDSQNLGSGAEAQESPAHAQTPNNQHIVNLLFRMRTKRGGYTWVESVGRLYVEAGKGRKAIVLSGRLCAMPNLRWGVISQAGGLLGPSASAYNDAPESSEATPVEQEFWAMLCEDGLFLVAGMGVRDLLGWGTAEMIGRSIREFIFDDSHSHHGSSAEQVIHALRGAYAGERGTQTVNCRMKKRDGEVSWMQLTLYANESRTESGRIIVQFKLLSASASASTSYPDPTFSNPFSAAGTINASSAYPFSFNPHPSYTYDMPSRDRCATTTSMGTTARILHQPNTNVFAEFETHRGTSWQYELQQLKYANDKLRQEVYALEERQRRQQQLHLQHQNRQQQQQSQNQQTVWVGSVQA